MKHWTAGGLLALALAALSPAVEAQQFAITARQVNLRAGPERAYPVVTILPGGVQVVVQGCVADYRWCDVSYGVQRGWVHAGHLRYASAAGAVPLVGVAPRIGIAIFPFVLYEYWGAHYRDRPWYAERERWVRTPPHAVVPRPAPPPHAHGAARPLPPGHAHVPPGHTRVPPGQAKKFGGEH